MLIKHIDYELKYGNGIDPGNRRYKLLRDYPFWYKTERIVIPKGFEWDGPTGVPVALGMYSFWITPSLMHDYMYSVQGKISNTRTLIQKEADEWFFYNLEIGGVPKTLIFMMKVFLKGLFAQAWLGVKPISKTALHTVISPLTISGIVLIIGTILYFVLPIIWFLF